MPRAARWRSVEAMPRGVRYNHHHHHHYATVLYNKEKDEKNDLNNVMEQYCRRGGGGGIYFLVLYNSNILLHIPALPTLIHSRFFVFFCFTVPTKFVSTIIQGVHWVYCC